MISKFFTFTASFVGFVGACVVTIAVAQSPQQPDALKGAADALGADRIKTLEFVASGANFTVGQNFTPANPGPL